MNLRKIASSSGTELLNPGLSQTFRDYARAIHVQCSGQAHTSFLNAVQFIVWMWGHKWASFVEREMGIVHTEDWKKAMVEALLTVYIRLPWVSWGCTAV